MAIPTYEELMLPVLAFAASGETTVPLAEASIAARLGLTDEEREKLPPSGKQRVLNNRIHWAKFYLTKAGFLKSPKRGRFAITPDGQALLANLPPRLNTEYLLTIPAFRAFHAGDGTEGDRALLVPTEQSTSTATPEEVIDTAYNAVLASLRADLLEQILQNSPTFFERLIVDLLVGMGYGGSHKNAAEKLGKSGDGGVDGVINEDILGLDRVYVQAKRYAPNTTVGRPEVQAFTGSLVGFGAAKGVFVTTSSFSVQAHEYVGKIPQRVILIDGDRLTELMVEHGVGVRESRTLVLKRIDEDFFSED